jgi:hypothetical protein
VCRVCVADEFHAFYTLYAFTKPVTYGKMEGWKVQVPSPASIKSFNSTALQAGFSVVCVPGVLSFARHRLWRGRNARQLSKVITSRLSAPIKSLSFFSEKICQTIFGCRIPEMLTAVKRFGERMLVSTLSLGRVLSHRLDPHILDPCVAH